MAGDTRDMEAFATIRARAAARKGGEAALDALMPAVKSAEALRAIPDDRWLAGMAKRIFQAGFVWKVIEDKWPGFEAAFDGFDPKRVAMMADGDLDALLADDRIVRNGRKIEATRENAVFLVDLAREHGSAARFFADWPDEDYIGLLDLLKERGSRLGGFTGQSFLRHMGKDSFIVTPDVCAALVAAGVIDKAPKTVGTLPKGDFAKVQAAFNAWRAESGRPMAHIGRTLACSVDA